MVFAGCGAHGLAAGTDHCLCRVGPDMPRPSCPENLIPDDQNVAIALAWFIQADMPSVAMAKSGARSASSVAIAGRRPPARTCSTLASTGPDGSSRATTAYGKSRSGSTTRRTTISAISRIAPCWRGLSVVTSSIETSSKSPGRSSGPHAQRYARSSRPRRLMSRTTFTPTSSRKMASLLAFPSSRSRGCTPPNGKPSHLLRSASTQVQASTVTG